MCEWPGRPWRRGLQSDGVYEFRGKGEPRVRVRAERSSTRVASCPSRVQRESDILREIQREVIVCDQLPS